MSNVVVREIDVRDDTALHAWWQASHAAHQGRRVEEISRALGLAVKLANHRSLRAAVAQCTTVLTDNADTNVHMNAVNEAMGYRLVEDLHEVQKELP